MPKNSFTEKIDENIIQPVVSEFGKSDVAKTYSSSYTYSQVQSLMEARLVYIGEVTKSRYEWLTAGTIILVNNLDVPDLLAQRVGKTPCCGGGDGNRPFQIVN